MPRTYEELLRALSADKKIKKRRQEETMQYLRQLLSERAWRTYELATLLDLSPQYVNKLIRRMQGVRRARVGNYIYYFVGGQDNDDRGD